MKKLPKRILIMILCLVMMAAMCTPAFALDKKTTELYAKQLAVAGIQKVTGMIPEVGESISGAIGNFLPGMLGIESDHDKVMAKLEEISAAIEGLDFKLNQQQQDLFREFHLQRIESFNDTANELKGTIDSLYNLLMDIEDEYAGKSQNEKQVAIATLIESNKIDNSTYAIAQLKNITDYLCGTQISGGSTDGIFQLVYAANCKDSALGGEAALKSAAYVSSFSQYMETAYKTLFAIYASKLYVCENSDTIAAEMAAGTIPKHDISTYTEYDRGNIASAIFNVNNKNNSSLLTYYNKLFNEEDDNSVISRYNSMLADVWFSYIESTDYTQNPAKIDYIPLDSEISFLVPYNIGYGENLNKETTNIKGFTDYSDQIKDNFKGVDKSMLSATHPVLTNDQISRLMGHLATIPALGMDEGNPSIICVLDYLGFSFDAYNAYVDKLRSSSDTLGATYRDPSLPRAETDGMTKVLPMSTKAITGTSVLSLEPPIRFEEKYPETPTGWDGDYVVGYDLNASVNEADATFSAQMVKICHLDVNKGETIHDPNVMLLYFTEPIDAPFVGTIFSELSPAAIVLICVGAAAIIAVPTVILVRRKKKTAN